MSEIAVQPGVAVVIASADAYPRERFIPQATRFIADDTGALYVEDVNGKTLALFAPGQWQSAHAAFE